MSRKHVVYVAELQDSVSKNIREMFGNIITPDEKVDFVTTIPSAIGLTMIAGYWLSMLGMVVNAYFHLILIP